MFALQDPTELFSLLTNLSALWVFFWVFRQRMWFKCVLGSCALACSFWYHTCRAQCYPDDDKFHLCTTSRTWDVFFAQLTFVDLSLFYLNLSDKLLKRVWITIAVLLTFVLGLLGVTIIVPLVCFASCMVALILKVFFWKGKFDAINWSMAYRGAAFMLLGVTCVFTPAFQPKSYPIAHGLWHLFAGLGMLYLVEAKGKKSVILGKSHPDFSFAINPINEVQKVE